MTVDQDKLMAFVGQMVTDLGAAVASGGVVIGHRLGLYRALAQGPATPDELDSELMHFSMHPPVIVEVHGTVVLVWRPAFSNADDDTILKVDPGA